MQKRKHISTDANLLTVDQAATKANLGKHRVREIAEEAGAVLKIGTSVRVEWDKFYNFLIANYKEPRDNK